MNRAMIHMNLGMIGFPNHTNRAPGRVLRFSIDTDQFPIQADRFSICPDPFGIHMNQFLIDMNRFAIRPDWFLIRVNQFPIRTDHFSIVPDHLLIAVNQLSIHTNRFPIHMCRKTAPPKLSGGDTYQLFGNRSGAAPLVRAALISMSDAFHVRGCIGL
jgi:hypothetical protein